MGTIIELLKKAVDFLRTKGIEFPKSDVEWIFSSILRCSRLELYLRGDREITLEQKKQLRVLLLRRATREPLQYILGEVDFCNVKLRIDPRVLIPRSETEALVEWILEHTPQNYGDHFRILDLGTGSGAIALSLAKHYTNSEVIAVDRSQEALEVARENIIINGISNVKFLESDWFSAIDQHEKFDIIVSNPPYLTLEEFECAQDEVRKFEPKAALIAEDDGRRDLEKILDGVQRYLKANGIVALETGIAHPAILQEKYKNKFSRTEILRDLSRRERFFIAYK